jgi:SAM-dependent methyltransferase
MDARDLSAFANASFDLVIFSYNGIDSVDPEGRLAILNEVSRVLSPGGTFLFSTFHRGWEGFNDRRIRGDIVWSGNPLRLGLRYARHAVGIQRAFRRRKLEERDGEHAILLHFAHHYGIMVYATTPEQINRQLSDAGFKTPARIFDEKGREISDEASAAIEHFHVMARKPLNDKGRPM